MRAALALVLVAVLSSQTSSAGSSEAAQGRSGGSGHRQAVTAAHASLQFSDGPGQHVHDARKVFAQGWGIITGTEAGPGAGNLPAALRGAARAAGYRLCLGHPGDSWVAASRDLVTRDWKCRTIFVAPGSRVSGDQHGRYGPRTLATATFKAGALGRLAVAAAHYMTKSTYVPARADINRKIAARLGDWARHAGRGARLAFVGADANLPDRVHDVFYGEPLRTAWDALRRWPNTGHGNIDVQAVHTPSDRVSLRWAKALPDSVFHMFTDHFPIVTRYRVTTRR